MTKSIKKIGKIENNFKKNCQKTEPPVFNRHLVYTERHLSQQQVGRTKLLSEKKERKTKENIQRKRMTL